MDKINYIALCDSEQRAFVSHVRLHTKKGKKYPQSELKYLGAQIKHVHKDMTDCPDCKSVLFWTTEEKLHAKNKKVI